MLPLSSEQEYAVVNILSSLNDLLLCWDFSLEMAFTKRQT